MGLFFISYKHENIDFAELLDHKIGNQDGFTSWYDKHILAGDEWENAIDNHIKQSIGIIIVITPLAMTSHYITYEWSYALGLGKSIIPIILEYPGEPALHPKLLKHQYIDFRTEHDWDNLFKALDNINHKNDISPQITNAENVVQSSIDPNEWRNAIRTLEEDNHPQAIEALANQLGNTSPNKMMEISLALAKKTKYLDERPIEGLYTGISHKLSIEDGAIALGRIGTPKAVSKLIDALNLFKNHPINHEILIRALGYSKDKTASVYLQKEIVEGQYKIQALDALARNGDGEAAPFLTTLLVDSSIPLAMKAALARTIGKLGNSSIVPELVKLMDIYHPRADYFNLEEVVEILKAIATLKTDEGDAALKKYMHNSNFNQLTDIIINALKANESI